MKLTRSRRLTRTKYMRNGGSTRNQDKRGAFQNSPWNVNPSHHKFTTPFNFPFIYWDSNSFYGLTLIFPLLDLNLAFHPPSISSSSSSAGPVTNLVAIWLKDAGNGKETWNGRISQMKAFEMLSPQENVSVTLYYETLCPYCADFIVNHLAKIFDNGLISVVNLRMVPWGNAWLNSDGSFACQHGTDECLLNTIEACTITIYPNVNRHFRFIHCVEQLTLQNKHNKWANCFEMSKLGTVPIDCYNSGYGNQIETKYAKETAQLNPPHRFVPWLVVNNKPLAENYDKFMTYICKAYKGKSPEACRSIRSKTESIGNERSIPQVCLAEQGRNSTS